MRGLLRKDLELARLNIKMWGVLFFIGVIYLFNGKSMDGGSFFTAYNCATLKQKESAA